MESSTRTEDVDGASLPAGSHVGSAQDAPTARHDLPTAEHPVAGAAGVPASGGPPAASGAPTKEVRPSVVGSIHEQCSACGAAMASDQHYCLACGERNGPARVPALDQGRRPDETPAARPQHRPRASANTTLIAGIGTLLLALGVGVLIGRSSNNSTAKTPPAQVVTVTGGGGSAGSAGTAGAASTTSTPAHTPAAAAAKPSTSSSAGAGGGGGTKVIVKKPSGPPPKAVHIGSPGKGPGYQHGHFTGNFFGPEAEGK